MIGDVALARALAFEYSDLRSLRPANFLSRNPHEMTDADHALEARISDALARIFVVEARLREEGLMITADGELASTETGMKVAA